MIARPIPHRRGLALILALVLLGLVSALGATMLRGAATARLVADQAQRDARVAWLVEAGIARARAQLFATPDYAGETWTITPLELGGRHGASVVITVEPAEEQAGRRRVSVRAEYPAGDDPTRAARSRRIILNASQVPSRELP